MKIKKISKNNFVSSKKYYDVINANPYNNFLVKTNSRYICSHNCFMDEVSFIANQDIEKQKQKAYDILDTAMGGMATRFTRRGKNPTMLVLASSKRSEKSFLETHMKKKLETEKENVFIVDEPVWHVRPASEYCGKTFWVAQGNKFLASEVIPEDPADIDDKKSFLKPFRDKGYKILDVPVEYRAKFLEDIDRALCDYAGVSSSDLTKYISGTRLQSVKLPNVKNMMTKEILEVGNAPDDKTQYYDFADIQRVDPSLKYRPLFIHLDMSTTGDKTGIAGVWILGKKPPKEGEPSSKELYYQTAFGFAVKAPRGYQISFEKHRQFIYWLREQGFNIKGVSADSFQSADLAQQITAQGFNYTQISVDRIDPSDKICKPYHYLKNTIYEERIRLFDSELLTEELLGLERNSNGVINHPDEGRTGCFTGDTKVRLVDGRSLTFLELVKEYEQGKINWVYSFNENKQRIEPKKILKAWCTQKNASLVQVVLDNNEVIQCTPNHRFMLRDGSYKYAKDLTEYDFLKDVETENRHILFVSNIRKQDDVYDITVEDNHNFALDSGVFVHNSKDLADALCGAVYNASQHAEEFAFDFGENIDTIIDTNSNKQTEVREQITVDFEEELKKTFDTTGMNNSSAIDFGMGKAQVLPSLYTSQGIIVW